MFVCLFNTKWVLAQNSNERSGWCHRFVLVMGFAALYEGWQKPFLTYNGFCRAVSGVTKPIPSDIYQNEAYFIKITPLDSIDVHNILLQLKLRFCDHYK